MAEIGPRQADSTQVYAGTWGDGRTHAQIGVQPDLPRCPPQCELLCQASIHSIRRQLGKKVDEIYTEVQRSQHSTQADPRIFGQAYVANTSSVDG